MTRDKVIHDWRTGKSFGGKRSDEISVLYILRAFPDTHLVNKITAVPNWG